MESGWKCICISDGSAPFMSDEWIFRLRLREFGRLHCFTHAKTQRAGGFYNEQRASALSSTKPGTGIPHISISYTGKPPRCQEKSLVRAPSVADFGRVELGAKPHTRRPPLRPNKEFQIKRRNFPQLKLKTFSLEILSLCHHWGLFHSRCVCSGFLLPL